MMPMLRYLALRLLSAIPALFLGVMALFLFRLLPPESAWEQKIEQLALSSGQYDHARVTQAKERIREQLGLDLPIFYCSVHSAALPTRWPEGFSREQREWAGKLALATGRGDKVVVLADQLATAGFSQWVFTGQGKTLGEVRSWLANAGIPNQQEVLSTLQTLESPQGHRALLPVVEWNGSSNQFHLWVSQLVKGHLGVSWRNGEPVTAVIGRALGNTLLFTIPAFFLIFLTAYWLVVGMSGFQPGLKRVADQVLYFFDLMPLFGWALLAMILFASGLVFSWFPSHVAFSRLTSGSAVSRYVWPYLLPALVLWVSAFPYVTKHIDNAYQKTASRPFVFMAYARGLSERTVRRKYRLRYALMPAITLVGEYLMAVISGALVVEVLFSIHGIGKLLADGVAGQDYPVVTGVVLLLIVVRMLSYLLTDILYYWLDPRIRLMHNG